MFNMVLDAFRTLVTSPKLQNYPFPAQELTLFPLPSQANSRTPWIPQILWNSPATLDQLKTTIERYKLPEIKSPTSVSIDAGHAWNSALRNYVQTIRAQAHSSPQLVTTIDSILSLNVNGNMDSYLNPHSLFRNAAQSHLRGDSTVSHAKHG